MKSFFAIVAVALAATIAACAPRGVTRMTHNVVGGHPVGGDLVLNVEKTRQGDSAKYELFLHWTSNFRLNIRSGQSLSIMADRQQFDFSAAPKDVVHDSNCEQGPCIYDERAYYPVTGEQIRAIAAASIVTVEVAGSKRSLTRDFNYLNFDAFRDFVAKHVPAPSANR